MSEDWKRRSLFVAAAWNVIGGVMGLASPAQHFAQAYTTTLDLGDPLQAFFYRGVWINVIAWGVGYLVAALRPDSRTAVLLAGGAGKLAYAAACVMLQQSGVGRPAILFTGIVDLLFAALFTAILLSERKGAR